jgi:hypothetical protein
MRKKATMMMARIRTFSSMAHLGAAELAGGNQVAEFFHSRRDHKPVIDLYAFYEEKPVLFCIPQGLGERGKPDAASAFNDILIGCSGIVTSNRNYGHGCLQVVFRLTFKDFVL